MADQQIEVKLVEATVQKLTLEPGDHLVVTLKGDEDLITQENMQSLSNALKARFPSNQVIVMFLPNDANMDLKVVKEVGKQENSCTNASFCANCNCGKKAAALNTQLPEEEDDES